MRKKVCSHEFDDCFKRFDNVRKKIAQDSDVNLENVVINKIRSVTYIYVLKIFTLFLI